MEHLIQSDSSQRYGDVHKGITKWIEMERGGLLPKPICCFQSSVQSVDHFHPFPHSAPVLQALAQEEAEHVPSSTKGVAVVSETFRVIQ